MAGVFCPNCGDAVLGFTRGNPHDSRCRKCDAAITAKWDGKTMVVTWNDNE